jgi:hypothetical protein
MRAAVDVSPPRRLRPPPGETQTCWVGGRTECQSSSVVASSPLNPGQQAWSALSRVTPTTPQTVNDEQGGVGWEPCSAASDQTYALSAEPRWQPLAHIRRKQKRLITHYRSISLGHQHIISQPANQTRDDTSVSPDSGHAFCNSPLSAGNRAQLTRWPSGSAALGLAPTPCVRTPTAR